MTVSGCARVLAVIGCPISHSLSPVMHNAAIRSLGLDYIYVPFHVLPERLACAVEGIRALEIAGVNVTIPHKERVIGFLDEVGQYARRIGSVNTIVNRDGRLIGESTDGPGFMRSVQDEWGDVSGCRAVILGAGGSAKAVGFALAGVGCRVTIYNRTSRRAESLAEELSSAFPGCAQTADTSDALAEAVRSSDLLVNTTSVGMRPDVDGIPVSPDLLRPGLMVYDLVYNPPVTRLVEEARARGARGISGISMLVYQGAESFRLWTGVDPPVDIMKAAVLEEFRVES